MVLPIVPQLQEDPLWCWAAVGSMVTNFYARSGMERALAQCDVASRTLARPCCPSPPPPGNCHVQQNLQKALLLCGHLNNISQPSSSFGVVQGELDAGRPLCAAFQYSGGALHYLVITGYDIASAQIALIDPATGVLSHGPYTTFLSNNSGTWAGWIFTK